MDIREKVIARIEREMLTYPKEQEAHLQFHVSVMEFGIRHGVLNEDKLKQRIVIICQNVVMQDVDLETISGKDGFFEVLEVGKAIAKDYFQKDMVTKLLLMLYNNKDNINDKLAELFGEREYEIAQQQFELNQLVKPDPNKDILSI